MKHLYQASITKDIPTLTNFDHFSSTIYQINQFSTNGSTKSASPITTKKISIIYGFLPTDLSTQVNSALPTDITYEQHYLRTLPTDSESVGKFSITYQLLPTNSESVGKFSITYQLLSTDLYYLPTIIIIIIHIILKY